MTTAADLRRRARLLPRDELRLFLVRSPSPQAPQYATLERLLDQLVGTVAGAPDVAYARDRLERVLMQADLTEQVAQVAQTARALDIELPEPDDELVVSPVAERVLGEQVAARLVDGFRFHLAFMAAIDNLRARDAAPRAPQPSPATPSASASAFPAHLTALRAGLPMAYWANEAAFWRAVLAVLALALAVMRDTRLPDDVAAFLAETYVTGVYGALRAVASDEPGIVPEQIVPASERLAPSSVRALDEVSSWAWLNVQLEAGEAPFGAPDDD